MLKVYNTLTKQKEEFKSIKEQAVNIYVCGVTPYNHPHIGNARPFVTWDVIRRYLEFLQYDVTHVQNFTDVDDKIINKANEQKRSWDQVAGEYINAYFEVMDKLNVKRAHVYPRVSTHMKEIIDMVQTLVDKGYAYVVDGDVYYRVEKFEDYGKLSGRTLDDMQAGARVDIDERKENPMDFALWKNAKPGEPSWVSPWGNGRPGWHIECSAMSYKYLGASFDFHGGGSDLIFPHHENEIAQSEACTGCKPFVKYWLHNGFITVNEEKMSKSLGNFFLVLDILEHFPAEVMRFFILSTHYRSPLDFSDERLRESQKSLERLAVAKENLQAMQAKECGQLSGQAPEYKQMLDSLLSEFTTAMDDDFNTALAISHMFTLAREINKYKQESDTSGVDGKIIDLFSKAWQTMTSIIGVLEDKEVQAADDGDAAILNSVVEAMIAMRAQAKADKNYAQADAIRNALQAAGVALEDTRDGVRWKKA